MIQIVLFLEVKIIVWGAYKMIEKQWVAGTVMALDKDGKSVFLVANQSGKADDFSFPATKLSKDRTGLASILEDLKEKLTIEVSSLNLFELTNAVVDDMRIPLFIFEMPKEMENLEMLLKPSESNLSWQHTSALRDALKTWEISGVPQF